ncbi:MAG TPA: response regulator [Methanoregulaceae archaeon]|nr:response regulator [Methanoregulaceae archaeon]HPD74939.1 response regulator [Methanoregulaceae archaeon]HRY75788.1 response regulator [Methanoregulaceae archaeon]
MKSIMVVEDDQPIIEMMELMLHRLGFEPLTYMEGPAALAEVQRSPPSLILLDVMMTPMNGWEFLERLRASPATKNLPVLLFTAHPSVESKVAGMNDPNLGILLKPVTLPELEKGIRRFLPPDT